MAAHYRRDVNYAAVWVVLEIWFELTVESSGTETQELHLLWRNL